MTALELCRQHADLEFAPVLRVIKYLGLDSNELSDEDITKTVTLYPHFEANPELIVGLDRVAEATDLDADRVREILRDRRVEIPFLGSPENPMVPSIAVRMIRAAAGGGNPIEVAGREWARLEELSRRTGMSVKLLSRHARNIRDVDELEERVLRGALATAGEPGADGGTRAGDPEGTVASKRSTAKASRLPDHIVRLEHEVREAQEQLKGLANTLSGISRRLRKARSAATSVPAAGAPRRGTRRRGGGKPNTIVEACRKVLEAEGGSMRVAEITDRVLESGVKIRAKNPSVTISSILSSYDAFERVRRGYYRLAS